MQVINRMVALAAGAGTAAASALLFAPPSASASPTAFISQFHKIRTVGSTVPKNGDQNPYGIVVIGTTAGRLTAGDILISNFNNKKNLQGTGSTIVELTPAGHLVQFARITKSMLTGRCPGGAGLTTALTVLPGGWVVVGSTPSSNGQASTSKAGCLIVLGNKGRVRETFHGNGINGPWDATSVSHGAFSDVFVTNVLNGTAAANGAVVHMGTVLRLRLRVSGNTPPTLMSTTMIGSGFAEQTSSTAFVLGPTGVGLSAHGTLYVADTVNSAIDAIPNAIGRANSAGTGTVVTSGGSLNAPLGLTIAPNGDILTVNGNDGKVVETAPGQPHHAGMQVATMFLDKHGSPPGAGALFGLTIAPGGSGVYYVDDAVNTLRLLH